MTDWLAALRGWIGENRPSVLVTIIAAKGSAPREAGAKMVVTSTATAGTVGGGNLEHEAIRIARTMLAQGRRSSERRRFALGPSLGQCCGGSTTLLFEPFPEPAAAVWAERLSALRARAIGAVLVSEIGGDGGRKLVVTADEVIGEWRDGDGLIEPARRLLDRPGDAVVEVRSDAGDRAFLLEKSPGCGLDILLIGAGHVGKALIRVLASLPCRVTWADDRPEQFPDDVPANVTVRCTPHLERTIDAALPGTVFLVMTYSHDLDYALCARVLQRRDFRYLGLIGSATKRARFERTMRDLGIDQGLVDRVVCPIGVAGVTSKQPAVIAVAAAAQILALPPHAPDPGPGGGGSLPSPPGERK